MDRPTYQILFNGLKKALVAAAQLSHWHTTAETGLIVDGSDAAVGAVIQQKVTGVWQPHGFFSKAWFPYSC